MKVLGISGSPSAASRTTWLVDHVLGLLPAGRRQLLEVRDLPAQALVGADPRDPQVQAALVAVAEADVLVLGTPIYKASYSGLLKVFLDLLPPDGLRGKRVLPLATAGSAAHLLALDYALKPVLSALGARDFLDGIYAVEAQLPRDAQGQIHIDPELSARLLRAIHGSAPIHLAKEA